MALVFLKLLARGSHAAAEKAAFRVCAITGCNAGVADDKLFCHEMFKILFALQILVRVLFRF